MHSAISGLHLEARDLHLEVLAFARVRSQHQSEMVVVGDAALRQKDTRPWLPVGLVVSPSYAEAPAAVETQRRLLVQAAKDAHKQLRPLKDLNLAYCRAGNLEEFDGEHEEEPPRLGSFRCSNCGAFNVADARACTSCYAERPETAPPGRLTMAMRTRKLDIESCGFLPQGG